MKLKIVLMAIATVLIIQTAGATTLSYTDVSCINSGSEICSSSMFVYYPNGTLAGTMNGTNDNIEVDGNQAINLYLKPNSASLLNNPSFTFQWILNSWNMFFVLLLIMGIVVSMFYIIKRLFMGNTVTPIGGTGGGWQAGKKRWR